jgi:hypothetical protein
VVADSPHFDEDLDLDPQSEKLDPDQHLREKVDPDRSSI